jgi:hypothetical protein
MAQSSTSNIAKGKNKKTLYIALGILALGGLIWGIMRRKKTSSIFLNITNYPSSIYAPLTDAQIKSELEKANALVASKGVDGAIADLQSQIASLQAQGTPESLALASLLQDFIADLETQKANEIRSASMASIGTTDTTSTGSMSIADNAMVNDGTNITLGTNTATNPNTANGGIDDMLGGTKSLTTTTNTPSALTNPQTPQLTNANFNSETYDGVIPQTTIDGLLQQYNAQVLSNGNVTSTVASLLTQSEALANKTNPTPTELATAQLLYDMAVTYDVTAIPSNASKYAVIKDANWWRNYLIQFFKLDTATPDNAGFVRWCYIKWAIRSITFNEPLETDYDNLLNGAAKTRLLNSVIATNGAIALLSNINFNITPSGKLVANRTPTART